MIVVRAMVVIAVCIGCGVKGYPRPAQPALPPPVTVPSSAPVEAAK